MTTKLIEAPASATVGRCRSCKQPVVWTVTSRGCRIPVAADDNYRPIPSTSGRIVPVDYDIIPDEPPAAPIPVAVVEPPAQTETLFGGPDNRPRWSNHLDTCDATVDHPPLIA